MSRSSISTTGLGRIKEYLPRPHPRQGEWTEEEYLQLTDGSVRGIEFTDGFLEVLPMPTDNHQAIIGFLFVAFHHFITTRGGLARVMGIRVMIRERKFREPDITLIKSAEDARRQNRFWTGADLAVEVVSEDKPARDLVDKRFDYAEARIPEYWIVNPLDATITVLKLVGEAYEEHGCFRRGQEAASATLEGFKVSVDAVFDAN